MRSMFLPVAALALIGASDEAEIETLHPDPPLMAEEVLERFKGQLNGNTIKIYDGKDVVTIREFLRRNDCRDRLDYAQADPDAEGHAPRPDEPSVTFTDRPLYRRGPGSPENPPLAIYAVDRRENGCGVMVMMGKPDDVRPLPSLSADDHRLMPADGDED